MNKKKISIAILLLALMSFSTLGAWVIHVKGNQITGMVTSNKDSLVFIENQFQDLGVIDVTNASQTLTQTATIKNNNGNLSFQIYFNETRLDFTDECTDYLDDVIITYTFEGSTIISGDTINLASGVNELDAEFFIARSSCPQNVTTTFELMEA